MLEFFFGGGKGGEKNFPFIFSFARPRPKTNFLLSLRRQYQEKKWRRQSWQNRLCYGEQSRQAILRGVQPARRCGESDARPKGRNVSSTRRNSGSADHHQGRRDRGQGNRPEGSARDMAPRWWREVASKTWIRRRRHHHRTVLAQAIYAGAKNVVAGANPMTSARHGEGGEALTGRDQADVEAVSVNMVARSAPSRQ